MADRVLVFSNNPGTITARITIDLPKKLLVEHTSNSLASSFSRRFQLRNLGLDINTT